MTRLLELRDVQQHGLPEINLVGCLAVFGDWRRHSTDQLRSMIRPLAGERYFLVTISRGGLVYVPYRSFEELEAGAVEFGITAQQTDIGGYLESHALLPKHQDMKIREAIQRGCVAAVAPGGHA